MGVGAAVTPIGALADEGAGLAEAVLAASATRAGLDEVVAEDVGASAAGTTEEAAVLAADAEVMDPATTADVVEDAAEAEADFPEVQ